MIISAIRSFEFNVHCENIFSHLEIFQSYWNWKYKLRAKMDTFINFKRSNTDASIYLVNLNDKLSKLCSCIRLKAFNKFMQVYVNSIPDIAMIYGQCNANIINLPLRNQIRTLTALESCTRWVFVFSFTLLQKLNISFSIMKSFLQQAVDLIRHQR